MRPNFDPRLKSGQRLFLGLLMQMVRAGMIEFAETAEPSVAPFFIAEHDGSGKVRMVLDTHRGNERFMPPYTTELSTPGAWQGLRLAVDSNLNHAQVDIKCAFYRIASPPGLKKLMVPLPPRRAYLVATRPDVDVSHGSSSVVSPRLIVLPLVGTGASSSAKPRWRRRFWLRMLQMLHWCTIGKLCKVSSCLQWWQLTWAMLRFWSKINRE